MMDELIVDLQELVRYLHPDLVILGREHEVLDVLAVVREQEQSFAHARDVLFPADQIILRIESIVGYYDLRDGLQLVEIFEAAKMKGQHLTSECTVP